MTWTIPVKPLHSRCWVECNIVGYNFINNETMWGNQPPKVLTLDYSSIEVSPICVEQSQENFHQSPMILDSCINQ